MDEKEQECPIGSIQVAEEKRETLTLFPEVPEPKPKQSFTDKRKKTGDSFNVWKLLPLIAFAGAILYILAGFFAVPFLVQTVLPERFEERIGRPVTFGSVAFNPFTLQLTVSNAIIGAGFSDPDDEVDPILSFSNLQMNIEAVSIFKHGLVCRKLEIDNPFVHVEKDGDNLYNISDLFPPVPKPERQEKNYNVKGLSEIIGVPFSFHLKNVIVNNGHIRFDDRPANQSHNAEEINLVFPLLTNFPSAAGSIEALIQSVSPAPPRFSAIIDGGFVNLIGETEVTDQAVKTTYKINFKALDLVALSHYFPNRLDQPVVAGGKADLNLDLIFTSENKGTDANLEIRGGAQFLENGKNQAKITFSGKGLVHAMPFKAEGFLVMEGVDIARFGPYFHPAPELRVKSGQASRMEARFMLGKDQDHEKLNLILTDAALQFQDLTLAEFDTQYLHLPDLTFSNAGLDMNRKILDLGLVRAEKGSLLLKWDKKGELNWKKYFVYKGQEKNGEKKKSWVVRAHSLDFSNGLVDIDSCLEVDPLNLRLEDVLFDFRSNPPLVEISSILADGPVVKLLNQGDGPLSAGFFKGSRSKKDGNKSRNKLKIGAITVNNGDLVYSDTTPGSPCSFTLSDLSGSISGIINSPGNRAAFSLKGGVPSPKGAESASSLYAKGKTGLFDERLFADLTVKIVNMDIRPLSPWFSHNLGYMVSGGAFDLTSIFRQENLEMSGSNQIRVTGLELGKRIDEKSQLLFAIGLLSDQDNMIDLDLSVTGPAGPFFSYGHGLAGGLRGLLLKTRIFPFFLLPLSPDKQVPPDHLIIPYGRSELTKNNMAQLKEMARILKMRPSVELKILGFAEPNGDGESLLTELKKEAARRRIEEDSRFFNEMSMDYMGEEIRFPRPGSVENEKAMPAAVTVSDDLLISLAKQRANAVKDFFVNDLDVAPDRIHVDKSGGLIKAGNLGRPGNRVDFILMVSGKVL